MKSKPAYQFDLAGLYIGETIADESPLEPGVYHIPARSTLEAPPKWIEGQWPRWNGNSWDMVNNRILESDTTISNPTAVEKLRGFLAENPDVAAMLDYQI